MKERVCKYIYYFFLITVFVFGIFIRLKYFVQNNVFEDDECRLAVFIYNKHLYEMFLPLGPLSSSPIFLFFSKIIAELTNYSEYALKTMPMIFSLAGIFMFYKLSVKYFKRKISVVLSNFLFAINSVLIYYSAIFKQYSLEVLLTIICLYYLPEIDLKKFSLKQLLIASLIMFMILLSSNPVIFFIGSYIVISILQNIKDKEFYKKLCVFVIPLFIGALLYYIFNLMPTKALQMQYYGDMWDSVYESNILISYILAMRFIFQPVMVVIPTLFMLIYYIIFLCDKSSHSKQDKYLALTFVFVILFHLLHLYPLYRRAIVFAIPLVLLMIVKPFDFLDIKKPIFYILSIPYFIFFVGIYIIPQNIIWYYHYNDNFGYSPKIIMADMISKYNPDKDLVITDEASLSSFMFYAKKMNFTPESYICIRQLTQLNELEKDKNYWIYKVKDFDNAPTLIFIQKWLQDENIAYSLRDKDSYLYYIRPPYKKVDKELLEAGIKLSNYIQKHPQN